MNFAWTASGEGVWRNSCDKSGCPPEQTQTKRALCSPAQVDGCKTRGFFRDDGLADLIGFKYSDWHADDAVGDFVQLLENIATFFGKDANRHVVSVILDGENAWEYFPDNGHHFLNSLYAALSNHPTLKVGTFAEQVAHIPPKPMKRLAAGSWVYGSFSTWIGSDDKNRGWDYLVAAKQAYDSVVATGKLNADQLALATRQLAVCEGSDWFWWFGDYNPASSVSDFEQLYRTQLRELYRLLGVAPPAQLDVPLSSGGGWAKYAGTMRRKAGGISTRAAPAFCCTRRRCHPARWKTSSAGWISCRRPVSRYGRCCRSAFRCPDCLPTSAPRRLRAILRCFPERAPTCAVSPVGARNSTTGWTIMRASW